MESSRKALASLTAGLIAAVLAGAVAGAAATTAPAQTATETRTMVNRTITVPAAAFAPATDNFDYSNYGYRLASNAGVARFTAPLYFEASEVIVRRLTLYAYDNNMAGEVCVTLYRTIPTIRSETSMGAVCSNAAFLEDPRVFVQQTLDPRRIPVGYGPYLYLDLPGPLSGVTGYQFYAVKITYSYETGA